MLTGAQHAAYERQWMRLEAVAELPERELVRLAVLLEHVDEVRRDRRAALEGMAEAAAAASAPEFREAIFEDYLQWEGELDVTEDDVLERHLVCSLAATDGAHSDEGEEEWDGEEDANEYEYWEGELDDGVSDDESIGEDGIGW